MKIPLEDAYGNVGGKAQRGLNLPGETSPGKLGLGVDALRACEAQGWYPGDPGPIHGLACFNRRYEDMTVDSCAVFDPETRVAAAFDTGADCDGMLNLDATIELLLPTHIHPTRDTH